MKPGLTARLTLTLLLYAAPCLSFRLNAQQVIQPGAPGQPSKSLPANTTAAPPQRSQADVDFLQGMIMHHPQAVAMTALIPSHTTNPKIRELGAKISSSQSDEMLFMRRWLAARHESQTMEMAGMPGMSMSSIMPGMLTNPQMRALAAARGPQFDRLFLAGMIQHHTGALVMVKDLFAQPAAGQDAALFNFATDADNTQRAEINIMQGLENHDLLKAAHTKSTTK